MQKVVSKFLRFLKDGVYGQVVTYGRGENMVLRSNGKIDSSTISATRSYQSMLGHIPMILHKKPSRVLNIGLGAGWTVNAVVKHPPVESVDSVEINPLIVEANRNVFYSYNGDVLNHPKVHSIINDGRNYVSHTRKTYEVIISEPTDFWGSGISALFTREFYTHARNALEKDGILCQWFPRYEINERDYKIAINTIKDVFPYAYEFEISKITHNEYYETHYKSFLIVASKEPIDIDKRLEERKKQCEAEPNEYHSHLLPLIRFTQELFSRDIGALEAYVADVHQLNTDDLPVLEFSASRDRFSKFRKE